MREQLGQVIGAHTADHMHTQCGKRRKRRQNGKQSIALCSIALGEQLIKLIDHQERDTGFVWFRAWHANHQRLGCGKWLARRETELEQRIGQCCQRARAWLHRRMPNGQVALLVKLLQGWHKPGEHK